MHAKGASPGGQGHIVAAPPATNYAELVTVLNAIALTGFGKALADRFVEVESLADDAARDADDDIGEERCALLSEYLDAVSDALRIDVSCDVAGIADTAIRPASPRTLQQLRYMQNCSVKAGRLSTGKDPTPLIVSALLSPHLPVAIAAPILSAESRARRDLADDEAVCRAKLLPLTAPLPCAAPAAVAQAEPPEREGVVPSDLSGVLHSVVEAQWEARAAVAEEEADARVGIVMKARALPAVVAAAAPHGDGQSAQRAVQISLLATAIRQNRVPFQALNTAFLSHLHQMPHCATPVASSSTSSATSLSVQS